MKIFSLLFRSATSIRDMLRRSYIAIIGALVIPTLLLILILLGMTGQYNRLIDDINSASILQETLSSDLQDSAWDVVAGKRTFAQAGLYDMLDDVTRGLSRLAQRAGTPDKIQAVTAAQRAVQTLGGYVDTLREQMEEGVAVSYTERSYREICSVSTLAQDVLQQYIQHQIASISALNAQIKAAAGGVLLLILLIFAVVLRFAVRSYVFVRKRVTHELGQLEYLTRDIAGGNLRARVPMPGLDELYGLSLSFNGMAERLQELIDLQVAAQKTLRKSEMRALQAQITPHFVYNTFETIIWLAEEGRNEEVVDITMAFTDFFRISLSRGQDYITVEQEKKHVSSYLAIQSVRYGSIVSYEIDIDESLYACRMLKLLLQPLVENAIYHGLKKKRGRGQIRVTGRGGGQNRMTFSVADDGVGIPRDELSRIRKEIARQSLQGNAGFGLFNVNQRICLYYGGQGLQIESEEGKGTCISFTISRTVPEQGDGPNA